MSGVKSSIFLHSTQRLKRSKNKFENSPSHEIIVLCSLSVNISRRNCHNWICPLLPVRLPWWPASTPKCEIIPVSTTKKYEKIVYNFVTEIVHIPSGLIAFIGFRPFGFCCFFICVTFSSDVFSKSGSPRIATILHFRSNSKCVQNVSPGSTGTFSWNSVWREKKTFFFLSCEILSIRWKFQFIFTFECEVT